MSKSLYKNYKDIWNKQENTLETLYKYIKDYNISVDKAMNITVSNDKKDGKLPVYCCHLDTVHRGAPDPVIIKDDILISKNDYGIGGDDKCGIVACLELLKQLPCKCIFFRAEEAGCIGAKKYNQDTLKNNQFMIEIDRKGSSDLIFKYAYQDMCSEEFQKYVYEQGKIFGFKQANGLFTDVSHLAKSGISRMNISAGYYLPHTEKEYVILSELANTITLCYNIGKNTTEQFKFEGDEVIEVKQYTFGGLL